MFHMHCVAALYSQLSPIGDIPEIEQYTSRRFDTVKTGTVSVSECLRHWNITLDNKDFFS